MSEVMRQEVYMFERLDQTSSGENMSYLKCLVYVRPTRENVDLLVRELQKPRYGTYYICEWGCGNGHLCCCLCCLLMNVLNCWRMEWLIVLKPGCICWNLCCLYSVCGNIQFIVVIYWIYSISSSYFIPSICVFFYAIFGIYIMYVWYLFTVLYLFNLWYLLNSWYPILKHKLPLVIFVLSLCLKYF